jgi:hypothetical protein
MPVVRPRSYPGEFEISCSILILDPKAHKVLLKPWHIGIWPGTGHYRLPKCHYEISEILRSAVTPETFGKTGCFCSFSPKHFTTPDTNLEPDWKVSLDFLMNEIILANNCDSDNHYFTKFNTDPFTVTIATVNSKLSIMLWYVAEADSTKTLMGNTQIEDNTPIWVEETEALHKVVLGEERVLVAKAMEVTRL